MTLRLRCVLDGAFGTTQPPGCPKGFPSHVLALGDSTHRTVLPYFALPPSSSTYASRHIPIRSDCMSLFVRLDLRYMPDLRLTLFSKALNPFSYYLYLFIFQSAVPSHLLHNNTGTTAEAPDAVAVYTLYAAFPRDPALTPVASRHSLINPFPRLLIIVRTRRRYRGLEPLPTRSE